MNDFHDEQIADALQERVSGGDVHADIALAAVTARATGIRRRRAAIAGGGALVGIVVVATLAVAGDTPEVVQTPVDTATQPDTPSSPVVSTVPTPTVPASIAPRPDPTTAPAPSTSIAPSVPSTSDASPVPSPSVVPAPSVAPAPSAPGSSAPVTTGSVPSTAPTTAGPAPSAPSTAPTTATSEPDEPGTPPFSNRVYSSPGGSISVSWDGVALRLESAVPASGYDADVEDRRPDRIRVRFAGSDSWRIEVRADDGVVSHSVTS